ncbi:MAG: hypothetical protein BIFFINMI_02861 [Phycisphaerae bacterium]|nr:hypothetical protein [Phycisphaerae bacterium]
MEAMSFEDDDFDDPLTEDEWPDASDRDDDPADASADCPYCGGEVHEDAQRCPHCGNWIIDDNRPAECGRASRGVWVFLVATAAVLLFLAIAAVVQGLSD